MPVLREVVIDLVNWASCRLSSSLMMDLANWSTSAVMRIDSAPLPSKRSCSARPSLSLRVTLSLPISLATVRRCLASMRRRSKSVRSSLLNMPIKVLARS